MYSDIQTGLNQMCDQVMFAHFLLQTLQCVSGCQHLNIYTEGFFF